MGTWEGMEDTFLHCIKILIEHSDSAIKHLDGTMYASKVSSHCTSTSNQPNFSETEKDDYDKYEGHKAHTGLLLSLHQMV